MISIILPTYNRPALLYRALSCVADQTHKNYECIVINDAGQDVSAIVDRFPNTLYLVNPVNIGLGATRNVGLCHARGDYIAYLDDDDIWFPEHLAVLYEHLRSLPHIHAAYTDCYRWYDEKNLFAGIDKNVARINEERRNVAAIICVMHEQALLEKIGYFADMRQMEDWDFLIRLSRQIGMLHIPRYTACYSKRLDDGQLTSNEEAMRQAWEEVNDRYKVRVPNYKAELPI
jgi:glycosyltransferase involved in cell wall biosynthesis